MRGEGTARARARRRICLCVRDARRMCRSCWQHYTTAVPGGTKWFFLALGGIFPHSLFVWRAVCTRRRSATLSVFFFVIIISSFPTLLFLSTFLHRTVGRHLAAYAGRRPRTLSPFRFLKKLVVTRLKFPRPEITLTLYGSTVVVAAVYGPKISFSVVSLLL